MSNVNILLSRLDKVKSTGKDSWRACCPAHNGSKQSLAIRNVDGKVLIHCFAEGCATYDVLDSVGLTFADIMPEFKGQSKASKLPFYSSDILRISRDEVFIAYLIVKKMLNGTVNFNDMQRLLKTAARLGHATEIANGGNGVPVMDLFGRHRLIERKLND